jgi:hypothetical protein
MKDYKKVSGLVGPSRLIAFPLDPGQVKRLITDQDEIQALVDRSYDGSSDESYFTETAGINRFGLVICIETDGKFKAFECLTTKDAEAVFAEGKKLLSKSGLLSIY